MDPRVGGCFVTNYLSVTLGLDLSGRESLDNESLLLIIAIAMVLRPTLNTHPGSCSTIKQSFRSQGSLSRTIPIIR